MDAFIHEVDALRAFAHRSVDRASRLHVGADVGDCHLDVPASGVEALRPHRVVAVFRPLRVVVAPVAVSAALLRSAPSARSACAIAVSTVVAFSHAVTATETFPVNLELRRTVYVR